MTMHTRTRRAATVAVSVLGAATLSLAGALGAAAHVSVTPTVTTAGSYTVLTFAVPHGCDGAGTTEVAIQVPESIISVTPTVNPGWDVEKVMVTLDEPLDDGHGGEYTERVGEVVYTAKAPLPEGYRDAFELSLKLPDVEGETLAFPTVQTCEQGETAWVQLPAQGQDAHELEAPAPAFQVTAAEGDGHGADAAAVSTEVDETEQVASTTSDTGAATALAAAGLVAGLLGLAAGGVALVRSRRP